MTDATDDGALLAIQFVEALARITAEERGCSVDKAILEEAWIMFRKDGSTGTA